MVRSLYFAICDTNAIDPIFPLFLVKCTDLSGVLARLIINNSDLVGYFTLSNKRVDGSRLVFVCWFVLESCTVITECHGQLKRYVVFRGCQTKESIFTSEI